VRVACVRITTMEPSGEITRTKLRLSSSIHSLDTMRPYDPGLSLRTLHYEKLLTRSSVLSLVLVVLFEVVAFWANDRYSASNDHTEDTITDVLRLLAIVISVSEIAVLMRYHILRGQRRVRHTQERKRLRWKLLLAEVLLHCLVLPPRVNEEWKMYQLGTYANLALCDVLFAVGLLRMYHLIRAIYWVYGYSGHRARFYIELEGVVGRTAFIWRSLVKRYTVLAFLLTWGVLNLEGGLALRSFDYSVPRNKVDSLWSAFWSAVVSETTIGYGDVIPLTHISRLTLLATVTSGMAIYSYVIMVVHRTVELNPSQHRLYGEIHYVESRKKLRNSAAILVQRWWKYYRNKWTKLPTLDYLFRFNFHLRTFRLKRRTILSFLTPLLSQSVVRFESDVKRRIAEETSHLQDIRSMESLVSLTQSRVLCTTEFSIRMKLRSIAHSSKEYKIVLPDRRFSTNSSREALQHRASISSIGSTSRKAKLHRARDLALKKLHKMKFQYLTPGTPSVLASPSSSAT